MMDDIVRIEQKIDALSDQIQDLTSEVQKFNEAATRFEEMAKKIKVPPFLAAMLPKGGF